MSLDGVDRVFFAMVRTEENSDSLFSAYFHIYRAACFLFANIIQVWIRGHFAMEKYEVDGGYLVLDRLLNDTENTSEFHAGAGWESSEICHEFDPANIPVLLAE